jgi:hypothetical protein
VVVPRGTCISLGNAGVSWECAASLKIVPDKDIAKRTGNKIFALIRVLTNKFFVILEQLKPKRLVLKEA